MYFNHILINNHVLDWSAIEQIPVKETNSPLVQLCKSDKIKLAPIYFDWGLDGATNKIYLRKELIGRLKDAANMLPEHIGLLILDGWRPIKVQRALREKMRQEIAINHPNASSQWIENELDNFVANPERSGMCPPHLTGGSVDVTLIDLKTMTALDMGSEFDEPGDISFTAALEYCQEDRFKIAKRNRRLLVNVMQHAGFTNIPTEWWHFDYGNANWAYFSGSDAALYGAAQAPF